MFGKYDRLLRCTLYLSVSVSALTLAETATASAQSNATSISIGPQPVASALRELASETGTNVLFSPETVGTTRTQGVSGRMTPEEAAQRIVAGTPLQVVRQNDSLVIRVAAATRSSPPPARPASGQTVETVVVTAEKKSEDIQNVPIAVSAFTQRDLKERQVATGGDLIREVPNMNFGKTNFSGYSIELRGIGTQAISVTTDPAVAVAFNGIPFIRNHFFEQEFFDLGDVEVLRGPQGTLYGRNATAGVVNLVSAKPTGEFEAMGSADFGNYDNRRLEGMLNIPIVGDKLDIRVAGEWTKRDGYSLNTTTDQSIDGRDLWSGRVSVQFKPTEDFEANLVWEHFSEDDNRLRSGKQLCETAPIPAKVNGVSTGSVGSTFAPGDYLSQGCLPASLYSKDSFEVPNGFSLPYYTGVESDDPFVRGDFNPYASTTQSTNLRDIQSSINPQYRAKNDIVELTADYKLTPMLTLTSQTGFNQDYLSSTEDYNRFDTAPGIFVYPATEPTVLARGLVQPDPNAGKNGIPSDAAVYCDPQLGCQDRLVAQDLDEEHAWQLSQEFRLASQFGGPLNFSAGGNYLHYETEENYYVFINTLTQFDANNTDATYGTTGTNTSSCLPGPRYPNNNFAYQVLDGCQYIDPNPIGSVNGQGHNYFLSQNPYLLNSYALFGEVYYNITNDLKLTGGLRWTDDEKHFVDIPSELLIQYSGYPTAGVVDQQWQRFTGRGVLSWTPDLDFSDQTLIYASVARGYKAGGANPPGALYPATAFNVGLNVTNPIHPLTFKPEYIDAYELGTKNAFLDGTLTLNADVFYYNYQNYQISEIVDRTAINNNYNAHVVGAELESAWEPLPGLNFNLAAGAEDARLANGTSGIDLMDRTAGNPNWMVVKPFVTNASNCVLPTYVVAAMLGHGSGSSGNPIPYACGNAYFVGLDPVTGLPYTPNPTVTAPGYPAPPTGYPGFNPATAPNDGEGFDKNLSHHAMPNAPPFTLSAGAQYTIPAWQDWTATLRGDFYLQADSWARVFNDNPYDRLRGYTNVNLALILNSADGWQVMGYVKNVFNTTAITGDFLNSDDSGLTTNVFLTDPRLFGIRVTKELGAGEWAATDDVAGLFADTDGKRPTVWVELGGDAERLLSSQDKLSPGFMSAFTIPALRKALDVQHPPTFAFDEEAKVSFQAADSPWILSAGIRFGRAAASEHGHHQTKNAIIPYQFTKYSTPISGSFYPSRHVKVADAQARESESHAIVDFKASKDLGLGFLGHFDASSIVGGGIRFVQFTAHANVTLRGEPDVHYTPAAPLTNFPQKYEWHNGTPPHTFHDYAANADASRSFRGVGPSAAWDASLPMFGDSENGEFNLDWGLNGALLVGRQKARGHHQTTAKTYQGRYFQTVQAIHPYDRAGHFFLNGGNGLGPAAMHTNAASFNRMRTTLVPNVGGFAGLSVKYDNAKVSFGYRADYFVNAMDGGWDARKSESRGFLGPFANVSIGLGG